MNNSEIMSRTKIIPAVTRSLGEILRAYLDAEIGKTKYHWLWGDDDPSLLDADGKRAIVTFPAVILVSPQIRNNRMVQNLEPVLRDIDYDKLTAKEFRPSKPVKLDYELRVLTNNPDNGENFALVLERASEEIFCIYPEVTTDPPVSYKVNIWWGEGRLYAYDVESSTRVYTITASVVIESRKFRAARLIQPVNPVDLTTVTLVSQLDTSVVSAQFATSRDDLIVYINEGFYGLPRTGTLEFKDWSGEIVQFSDRRLNAFILSEPLKHFHLQDVSLQIGV
jgi:hypothetical protein